MYSNPRLNRVQNLKNVLAAKPEGKRLLNDFEKIRKRAIPILSKITETFPEFTVHDIRHSDKVISILDWILVDELKNALNSYEIYFLLVAAVLHDIGMANVPFLLKTNEDYQSFFAKKRAAGATEDKILREYVRTTHQVRSEDFIVKKFSDLSIENRIQAQIIGRICRGHRDNLRDIDLYDHRTMYRSYSVNIPLLAAFLQLADEFDLDFERAPVILFNLMETTNPLTKIEWEKHLSITGIGPNVDDPLSIFVNTACSSEKVHRALKRAEAKIQKLLYELPDHLHQHNKFRLVIPQRISIEIKQHGYKVFDLKFALQEEEIFNLLMGEKIYDRKLACLRELLQNAVDTCRQRSLVMTDYHPKITFSIDRKSRTIVVSDNGMGMNMNIVENYFAKIGLCFYKSPEFLGEGYDFTPSSQFGIGILSCFMLAERVAIDTKMNGHDPLRIEMTSAFDYISVRASIKKTQGTTVTLFLKKEIEEDAIDLRKEIQYYARHLEFPIRIQSISGRSSWIRARPFKCKLKDFAPESRQKRKGLTASQWARVANQYFDVVNIPINEQSIEGNIGILLIKNKAFSTPLPEYRSARVQEVGSKIGYSGVFKVFMSNEGIYVNDISSSLYRFLSGQGVIFDVNLKGAPVGLDVSRTGFVRDDKFYAVLYTLLHTFFTYVEHCLEKITESQTEISEKFATTMSFYNSVSLDFVRDHLENPRRYTLSAGREMFERLVSRLKPLYEKAFYFRSIIDGKYQLMRYEELRDSAKLVIFNTHAVVSRTASSATSVPIDISYMFSHTLNFARAGETYLVSRYSPSNMNYCYVFYILDRRLYDSISELLLNERIKWTIKPGFEDLLPDGYQLAKFANFKTQRFVEIIPKRTMGPKPKDSFELDSHRFINADHAFMRLLAKIAPKIKEKAISTSLKTFFSMVVDPEKTSEALQLQRMILKELIGRDLVHDPSRFLLREEEVRSYENENWRKSLTLQG